MNFSLNTLNKYEVSSNGFSIFKIDAVVLEKRRRSNSSSIYRHIYIRIYIHTIVMSNKSELLETSKNKIRKSNVLEKA